MHKTFLGTRDLRDLRLLSGHSVDQVAEAVGVSAVRYRQWENGHRSPHLPELRKLAVALKASADVVLDALDASAAALQARRPGDDDIGATQLAPATQKLRAAFPAKKPIPPEQRGPALDYIDSARFVVAIRERIKAGDTLAAIADRAGLAERTVHLAARPGIRISINAADKIATALGLTIADFLREGERLITARDAEREWRADRAVELLWACQLVIREAEETEKPCLFTIPRDVLNEVRATVAKAEGRS